jgi:hypothetical protein
MTLNPHANYPSTRAFVLKLHRDAAPARQSLSGRLESLSTGNQFEFDSGAELLACLIRALRRLDAQSESPDPQPSQDQSAAKR